jgi:photosystem II stability/assembly factor-like uncharacterized protein
MRIIQCSIITALLVLSVAGPQPVSGQESTVYASVVATKLFVVGAANPRTGIHIQHPSADTAWTHTGPVNIRAFGIAVGPGPDQSVLYIASGNGVHKSTDGGATWKITTGWNITEVLGISPDPFDPDRVYIATPYGVYRTTDGCRTWQQSNSGLGATFVSQVTASALVRGQVICATESGAYVSTDGATSWKRMGLSVGGVRTVVQHPRNAGILAAGTENYGLYMSTDGGRIWTRREAGVDHLTFYAIAFDPSAPDTMYAGGYVTGVYRSLDGGLSWKRMNDGLSVLSFKSLAIDPRDGRRVYAGAYWGGVFVTEDRGGHWKSIGPPDSQVWTISIHP